MAITTSKPSRKLGRIPEGQSYEGLAAKYADDFRRATLQQEENEMNLMLSRWQRGEVSYEEVKKYLENKVNSAGSNSAKKSSYMDTLSKVEAQNQKNFEAEQKSKVDLKRAELTEKYMGGGISNQEQLAIVEALKKEVDPKSEAYRSVIAEEADLRTKLSKEGLASGTKVKANEIAQKFSELNTAMRLSQYNYQNGLASGAEYEQAISENAQEALDLLQSARESGIDVSRADYSIYDPNLGRESDIGSVLATSQQRQEWRNTGVMVDVVDKSGNLVPVTINQLQEDIIRNPKNPQYQRSPLVATQDPNTLQWKLADPATGEILSTTDKKGNTVEQTFFNKESAETEIKKMFPGYQLAVRTDNGFENWNYDPQNGSFSPQNEPDTKYMSIPTTGEQRSAFQYKMTPGMSEQDFNNLVTTGQKQFLETGGLPAAPNMQGPGFGMDFGNKEVAPVTEPKPTGIFNSIAETIKPLTSNLGVSTKMPGTGPIMEPKVGGLDLLGLTKKIGDFGKQITDSFKPSGSSFTMPDFNFKDFKLPSFNFNLPNFSQQIAGPSANLNPSSPSASGPTMSPSSSTPSFGQRIKSFGQQAIGTIGRLFGGQ